MRSKTCRNRIDKKFQNLNFVYFKRWVLRMKDEKLIPHLAFDISILRSIRFDAGEDSEIPTFHENLLISLFWTNSLRTFSRINRKWWVASITIMLAKKSVSFKMKEEVSPKAAEPFHSLRGVPTVEIYCSAREKNAKRTKRNWVNEEISKKNKIYINIYNLKIYI